MLSFPISGNFHRPGGRKRRYVQDYKKYDPQNLEKALEAVFKKQMNHYEAAHQFGVPRSTISRRYPKYKAVRSNYLKEFVGLGNTPNTELLNQNINELLDTTTNVNLSYNNR